MLLLAYIAFSAYHTLSSNKENAISEIQNQGDAILDVLLASFNIILNVKGFSSADKIPHNITVLLIDELIRDMNRENIVTYVCIVSGTGYVNYHSNPEFKLDIKDLVLSNINNKNENISKGRKLENGATIYDVVRRIPPLFKQPQTYKSSIKPEYDYIIVGIEIKNFEAARKADINHLIIMIAILMTLAGGTLFFIYIIRIYYHVNRELIESRDYIHSVVENMASGLISINRSGEIVACNRPAENLLGIGKHENNNQNKLSSVIDIEDTGIMGTITEGTPVKNKEINYKKPNGDTKTILLNATPLLELTDTIKGAVIILNDLSEIKALEEKVRKSEKLAVIGNIAAVVAHEIRNPLSSIRGFANFFCKTLSGDKNSEYACIVIEEVDRINRVITDLLQYSKSENLNLRKTDLSGLVDQTLLLVGGDIDNNSSLIINSVPDDLCMVNIDPDKMKQVLLNLLLNAIQVTDEKIHIEIGAEISEDNDLRFWVEDNGPGIEVEEKSSVFEPFFSQREQGTGLGLSIVQKIVENHNGHITFESPVNADTKGTRFILTLPVI